MKITDEQAKVAKLLISGPKPLDELSRELDMNQDEIKEILSGLMKFGLVRLTGDKYRLSEAVRRSLETNQSLNPEDYRYRAYIMVEGISDKQEVLAQAQESVLERFKADKRFEIIDLDVEDIIENEGVFTGMFEAEVVAKSFHDLIYLIITYGPSSIELMEPARFELKASEGQAILIDIAEMVHAYSQIIAQQQNELAKVNRGGPKIELKMNKQ